MNFGKYLIELLSVVVPGALTVALGALLIWGASKLWQRARGGTAHFYWVRMREGDWFLQRRKRRPAFDVAIGDGIISTSGGEGQLRAMAPLALGDMDGKQTLQVAVDNSNAWVSWVEGGRRLHSVSVMLSPDKVEIPVTVSKARGKEMTTAY